MKEDRDREGKEAGERTLGALGAVEFLTRNGLNGLSRLAMLWTVQHRWPAGARFAFN